MRKILPKTNEESRKQGSGGWKQGQKVGEKARLRGSSSVYYGRDFKEDDKYKGNLQLRDLWSRLDARPPSV